MSWSSRVAGSSAEEEDWRVAKGEIVARNRCEPYWDRLLIELTSSVKVGASADGP
jgi:hypothetical protein